MFSLGKFSVNDKFMKLICIYQHFQWKLICHYKESTERECCILVIAICLDVSSIYICN